MTQEKIDSISSEIVNHVPTELSQDLNKIVLYGSCARGDFSLDSDIDVALLLYCDRLEAKKYDYILSVIATDIAMKYFAVVNFACIPSMEFNQNKSWYPFFLNIQNEGKVLYGPKTL